MSHDPVNPGHYRSHPSGVECIQITEHMNFNLGNATKYIFRREHKGNPIQDLKKAAWYVSREIEKAGKELWATWPIDPRYEVSTLGEVRRADTKRLRKSVPLKSGYMTCMIVKNKSNCLHYVHRMVAETFLGPISKGKVVAHRDGNRSNNRLANLRIDSVKGNLRDTRYHGTHRVGSNNPASVLTSNQAEEIRVSPEPRSQLMKRFGVSRSVIQRIKTGQSYGDHRTKEQIAFENWIESDPDPLIRVAAKKIWGYSTGSCGISELSDASLCINLVIQTLERP